MPGNNISRDYVHTTITHQNLNSKNNIELMDQFPPGFVSWIIRSRDPHVDLHPLSERSGRP